MFHAAIEVLLYATPGESQPARPRRDANGGASRTSEAARLRRRVCRGAGLDLLGARDHRRRRYWLEGTSHPGLQATLEVLLVLGLIRLARNVHGTIGL